VRVTSAQSYNTLLSGIQDIQQRLQQAQTELTTGNKINQLSDDPSGAADIVRLTANKSEIAQYTSNAAAAQNRLQTTDSVLSNVQNVVQRVIALGEGALTNPSAALPSVPEIVSLRDQLVSSANTAFQGAYLFGGSVADKPSYVVQPDQSVTYQGNSEAVQVQVGRAATLQIQVPGDQAFSGSINVFDSVKKLSDAIQAGDKTAIQTQVNNLQQYFDSVSAVRSQVGALINTAQNAQSDLQSYELARASDQSRVQSADMAKASTDLTQAETSLQAALASGARISQLSILDFLP
jgi:flagellar hook-associated protein 3 FlgL